MVVGFASAADPQVPSLFWTWPFVAILLSIAILPLLRKTHHWWEENHNKLIVAVVLSLVTLTYYGCRGYGLPVHHEEEGGSHAAEVTPGGTDTPDPHGAQEPHARPDDSQNHAPAHDPAESAHEVTESAQPPTEPSGEGSGDHAAATHDATHDTGHDAGHGAHVTEPGWQTILAVLDHAVLMEYVPFLTLLFALYVVAGGIVVRGDIQATPTTNTIILAIGGLLASFIGTTGSSMVLIRVLLRTNMERKHVVHTVVFFIFIVSNIGGTLLPIGDPPLFLGYLKGVPFFWTLGLWKEWLFLLVILLAVYWVWDTLAYRRETPRDLRRDVEHIEPLRIRGLLNLAWVGGIIFAVITLDPSKPFLGTSWHPWPYLREGVQLAMVALSLVLTPRQYRRENNFNYGAIGEVACVFIGIFITMQVPLEILNARGSELGLSQPWHFFWATGILSSFLDNAPTYVVFFQTAGTLPVTDPANELALVGGGHISEPLLVAISCGAVFMGANSYIGNGPNFMVRTIAEQSGVRMPSFFGYMVYSTVILIPIFVVMTFVFF